MAASCVRVGIISVSRSDFCAIKTNFELDCRTCCPFSVSKSQEFAKIIIRWSKNLLFYLSFNDKRWPNDLLKMSAKSKHISKYYGIDIIPTYIWILYRLQNTSDDQFVAALVRRAFDSKFRSSLWVSVHNEIASAHL